MSFIQANQNIINWKIQYQNIPDKVLTTMTTISNELCTAAMNYEGAIASGPDAWSGDTYNGTIPVLSGLYKAASNLADESVGGYMQATAAEMKLVLAQIVEYETHIAAGNASYESAIAADTDRASYGWGWVGEQRTRTIKVNDPKNPSGPKIPKTESYTVSEKVPAYFDNMDKALRSKYNAEQLAIKIEKGIQRLNNSGDSISFNINADSLANPNTESYVNGEVIYNEIAVQGTTYYSWLKQQSDSVIVSYVNDMNSSASTGLTNTWQEKYGTDGLSYSGMTLEKLEAKQKAEEEAAAADQKEKEEQAKKEKEEQAEKEKEEQAEKEKEEQAEKEKEEQAKKENDEAKYLDVSIFQRDELARTGPNGSYIVGGQFDQKGATNIVAEHLNANMFFAQKEGDPARMIRALDESVAYLSANGSNAGDKYSALVQFQEVVGNEGLTKPLSREECKDGYLIMTNALNENRMLTSEEINMYYNAQAYRCLDAFNSGEKPRLGYGDIGL